MKIVYKTSTSFLDSDFPLIRQLQLSGHDVYTFVDLPCYALRSTLVDIKEQKPETTIMLATDYDEFKIFELYFDTSKLFVVNRIEKSIKKWSNIKIKHTLFKHIKSLNPDVLVSPCIPDFSDFEIFRLRSKLVLTVHDPFPHSGEDNYRNYFNRKIAMRMCKKIVLLNKTQVRQFTDFWHISPERILLNKMGIFDYMNLYLPQLTHFQRDVTKPNILFYGRISPYKGIEYLLEAMKIVHVQIPKATLTVVGGGKMYFDIAPYENLSYVEIRNYYIGMRELTEYLTRSSIVVCPYTDATQSGVVLTSFAMNKPVIATNVGAMGEYIEDGKTGILVPPCNSLALADAIIDVLGNPWRLAEMEQVIRERNMSNSESWSGIVQKYVEFYKM